eukprot:COSAG01_NODE_15299_length_1352_cov_56.584198_1_plen_279_part_00
MLDAEYREGTNWYDWWYHKAKLYFVSDPEIKKARAVFETHESKLKDWEEAKIAEAAKEEFGKACTEVEIYDAALRNSNWKEVSDIEDKAAAKKRRELIEATQKKLNTWREEAWKRVESLAGERVMRDFDQRKAKQQVQKQRHQQLAPVRDSGCDCAEPTNKDHLRFGRHFNLFCQVLSKQDNWDPYLERRHTKTATQTKGAVTWALKGYKQAVKQGSKDFREIENTISSLKWEGPTFQHFCEEMKKNNSGVDHLCADCWYQRCIDHGCNSPAKKQKTK